MNYETFLYNKSQLSGDFGFKPTFMPEFLFPFQKALLEWSTLKGRSSTMADCGLGKTPIQLCWAQNVVQETNRPVLILTPPTVGSQTVGEGAKFGIDCAQSRDGKVNSKIVVTNYQQLHKFDWKDFSGCACDESSILKNFDGQLKDEITGFMRKLKYRSLYTATAAPNDYIELGTSSEALGDLGYMDMLARFFKNAQNSLHPSVYRHRGLNSNSLDNTAKWRFRGHAEQDFWRWVCSWARAVRKPSDLGFSDEGYELPPLKTTEHIVKSSQLSSESLIELPAIGLDEQRKERSRTLDERCEMAASIADSEDSACVSWCSLNTEGDLLERLIPGAAQISGKDPDEKKEEILKSFVSGEIKKLVTKSSVCGFGLNWQHCHRQTHFASHSFERYYQSIRRSWRFGQTKEVKIDMVVSEGEIGILKNLNRKEQATEKMFKNLAELMGNQLKIEKKNTHTKKEIKPNWL